MENAGRQFQIKAAVDAKGNATYKLEDGRFSVDLDKFNMAKGNVFEYIKLRQDQTGGNSSAEAQFDQFSKNVLSTLQDKEKSNLVNLNEFHKNFNLPLQVTGAIHKDNYTNVECTYDSATKTFTVTQYVKGVEGQKASIISERDEHGAITRTYLGDERGKAIVDRSGNPAMSLEEYNRVKGDLDTYLQKRQELIDNGVDYRQLDASVQALNRAHAHTNNVLNLDKLNNLIQYSRTFAANFGKDNVCTDATLTQDGIVYQMKNAEGQFQVKGTVDTASRNITYELQDTQGHGFSVKLDDFNKAKNNVYAYMNLRRQHTAGTSRTDAQFDQFSKSVLPSLQGDKHTFVNLDEFHLNFPLPPQLNGNILNNNYTGVETTINSDGSFTVTQTVENSQGRATVITRREADSTITRTALGDERRNPVMNLDRYDAIKGDIKAYLQFRQRLISYGQNPRTINNSLKVLNTAHRNQRGLLDLDNLQGHLPELAPQLNRADCTGARLTNTGIEFDMKSPHGNYRFVSEVDRAGNFTHYVENSSGTLRVRQERLDTVRGNVLDYLNERNNSASTPAQRREFDQLTRDYYGTYRNHTGVIDLDNPMRHNKEVGTRNGKLNEKACYASELGENTVDYYYHSEFGDIRVSVNRLNNATIAPANDNFSVRQSRMDDALRSGSSYRALRNEITNRYGITQEDFDRFARSYKSLHNNPNGKISLNDTSRRGLRKAEIMVDGRYGGVSGGHHKNMHHLLIFHVLNTTIHDYFSLKKEELTGAVKIAETAAH